MWQNISMFLSFADFIHFFLIVSCFFLAGGGLWVLFLGDKIVHDFWFLAILIFFSWFISSVFGRRRVVSCECCSLVTKHFRANVQLLSSAADCPASHSLFQSFFVSFYLCQVFQLMEDCSKFMCFFVTFDTGGVCPQRVIYILVYKRIYILVYQRIHRLVY